MINDTHIFTIRSENQRKWLETSFRRNGMVEKAEILAKGSS